MLDPEVEQRLIVDLILPRSQSEIEEFVNEVKQYKIYSIQVEEARVGLVSRLFAGRRVGMLVGFPLGSVTTAMKEKMVHVAIDQGCSEILVTPNFNAFLAGEYSTVRRDLECVMKAVKHRLDVIALLQMADFPFREVTALCGIFLEVGIRIVKTNSTAKRGGGKTEYEHVQFLRRMFGNKFEIEASAGIRTHEQAKRFLEIGADRVHSSTWKDVLGLTSR